MDLHRYLIFIYGITYLYIYIYLIYLIYMIKYMNHEQQLAIRLNIYKYNVIGFGTVYDELMRDKQRWR